MSIGAARYTPGGDEHVFVELSEEMSLEAFFKGMAIDRSGANEVPGVSEICRPSASYQVRFDPDLTHPDAMVKSPEADRGRGRNRGARAGDSDRRSSRAIRRSPVKRDPAALSRAPPGSVLDGPQYAACISGYGSARRFRRRVLRLALVRFDGGFVAGLPLHVPDGRARGRSEVPKYLRPRTDTPKLTIGHGGCFNAIYSVRGAGGYQMFGITPAPIRSSPGLPYLKDFMVFFRPGDIVRFQSIDRAAYDAAFEKSRPVLSDLRISPGVLLAQTFSRRSRGLQPFAPGSSAWQLKSSSPELATTVQDAGRAGYYNVGIPLSGALDQYSFRAANLLVGNEENAAAIECTLLGPDLRFHDDAVIAVTGSAMTPKLDGTLAATGEAIAVRAGTVVSFDFMRRGARTYIAAGRRNPTCVVLGSRSTYGLGAFGEFMGRKLAGGDLLPVGVARSGAGRATPATRHSRCRYQRKWSSGSSRAFTSTALPKRIGGALFERRLEPSRRDAGRIGYRLSSRAAARFRPRKQPFRCWLRSLQHRRCRLPVRLDQVPGGLEPIVLHRDAVSGGGYAMIGTVISTDMDRIAQMQPNYKARFVKVDLATALAARADRKHLLDKLRAALIAS
jgi:biotin-dependent carboxylase-like uncharacterized protein